MIVGIRLGDKVYENVDDIPSGFYPKTYLRYVLTQRDYKEELSVTQLLKGTRQTLLEKHFPYFVDPDDAAFRVMGVSTHALLERKDPTEDYDANTFQEVHIEGLGTYGHFDLLEVDGDSYDLCDYKVVGAYSIKKHLGIQTKKVPMKDENGNVILLKSGANKGEPKMESIEEYGKPDPNDTFDYRMQVNIYALLVRKEIEASKEGDRFFNLKGKKLRRMSLFMIARDGGTFTARNYGIEKRTAMVPVEPIDEKFLTDYINKKQSDYQKHDKNMTLPDMCTNIETWNGRKCEQYCPVFQYCKGSLQDIRKLTLKEEENADSPI